MRIFTLLSALFLSSLAFAQTNHLVQARPNNTFDPNLLIIEVGDTVTWTNAGGNHNVNGSLAAYPDNPEGFSNGTASTASWTFQHVFTLPGAYDYQCDPHQFLGMVGTIIVNDNTGAEVNLVITEIMYNPPEADEVYEFIELFNNGAEDVNLLDYAFTSGIDFTFTSGYNLGVGEYVLIAGDSVAFEAAFGIPAFEWSGGLNNGGELIQFSDPDGNIVDEVDYSDGGGWPATPDGNGSSLVLCSADSDNALAESWASANTGTGFISGGVEIFANPGGASLCPDGPIVRFLQSEIEVNESASAFSVGVELSNGDGGTYTVDVINLPSSTATLDVDISYDPVTLTFDSGAMTDTLYVDFVLDDDMEPEPLETLDLMLDNAGAGLAINGLNANLSVSILDNDTEVADLVITEIMYNPPSTDSDYEYLEILNNGAEAVDLTGYYFSSGIEHTFPGITLAAGEYLLLVVDSVAFENAFGIAAQEWTTGALNNGGELLELRDASGNIVDEVTYSPGGDWPAEADGDGPALQLCDPSTDNALAENWIAAVEQSGVFIGGLEVLGSPGAANDCDPSVNPTTYTEYPIGLVTTVDGMGVIDSANVLAQLTGVVHGVNYRPAGLEFFIVDEAGDGIGVFDTDMNYGYTVAEGDEVTVQGVIGQFNGLAQIYSDSVWMESAGNMLMEALPVDSLDESTESRLVVLTAGTIVSSTVAGGGLNVITDDGEREHLIRVDFDTDITEDFINGLGNATLLITGIGSQFDNSSPFTEGYQLLPRYLSDIEMIESTTEPAWGAAVRLFPNPVRSTLQLELPGQVEQITVRNLLGRPVYQAPVTNPSHQLGVEEWPAGVYTVELRHGAERVVRRMVKQ